MSRFFICLMVVAGCFWVPAAVAQSASSSDEAITARLWNAMEKCWPTLADLPEPHRLTVVVKISLDIDGKLASPPLVVSPREVDGFDEAMQTAVARAVRATKKCAPYDFLPKERYARWQNMTLRFMHDEPLAIPQG